MEAAKAAFDESQIQAQQATAMRIEALEQSFNAEVEAIRREAADQRAQAQEQYATSLEQLKFDQEQQIQTLEAAHESKVADMQRQHEEV